MTLEQLCNEVLELDEKATKGPWPIRHELFDDDGNEILPVFRVGKDVPYVGPIQSCDGCAIAAKDDATLVAHYRTSAPKLAKAVQVLLLHAPVEVLAEVEKIVGE